MKLLESNVMWDLILSLRTLLDFSLFSPTHIIFLFLSVYHAQ